MYALPYPRVAFPPLFKGCIFEFCPGFQGIDFHLGFTPILPLGGSKGCLLDSKNLFIPRFPAAILPFLEE